MSTKHRKLKLKEDDVIVFENTDKAGWTENWNMKECYSDFPHPFRALIIAPVSRGKTSLIKNFIMKQKDPKPFEKIIIYHHTDTTTEYNDLTNFDPNNVCFIDHIPVVEDIDPNYKTLIIIDDVYVKKLNKKDAADIDRLYSYLSSHCNCSIIMTSQQFFNVPLSLRELMNIFCIFKIDNVDRLQRMSKGLGFVKDALRIVFKKYCPDDHDFITIDNTKNTPRKFRFHLSHKLPINIDLMT